MFIITMIAIKYLLEFESIWILYENFFRLNSSFKCKLIFFYVFLVIYFIIANVYMIF